MKLLIFELGGAQYGMDVEHVQSIESKINIVPIPNALPHISGIADIRGNVLPVYNLADRFGYAHETAQNAIVASGDGFYLVFLITEVSRMVDVAPEKLIPMPDMITTTQQYLNQVTSQSDDLVVLLDVQKLLSEEEKSRMQQLIEEKTQNTVL